MPLDVLHGVTPYPPFASGRGRDAAGTDRLDEMAEPAQGSGSVKADVPEPANPAFPHKFIQSGHVHAASLEKLNRVLLKVVDSAFDDSADPRLAALRFGLSANRDMLEHMSHVERTQYAGDSFRDMFKAAKQYSKKDRKLDEQRADVATLIAAALLELKRHTVAAGIGNELRANGDAAQKNFIKEYGVDDVLRPFDSTSEVKTATLNAGGGHNWIVKAVATLFAAVGTEKRIFSDNDGDANILQTRNIGIGPSVKLGMNALLASLGLTTSATLTRKTGEIIIASDMADLNAVLTKYKHEYKPDTLPFIGRSASPKARKAAAAYQNAKDNANRSVSGKKAWRPTAEPYYLSKTGNGYNTARLREILNALNEASNGYLAPQDRDAVEALAAELFPLEQDIRSALGPIGSKTPEEIKKIKNSGDDIYSIPAALTDPSTGKRSRKDWKNTEASLSASARVGTTNLPIGFSGKANASATLACRDLRVQRVNHDLVNLLAVDKNLEPAATYRALSAVGSHLGAITRGDQKRLGIDDPNGPAIHAYLSLLHAFTPPTQHLRELPETQALAPMLNLYGRYADMPTEHRKVLSGLITGKVLPGDLLRHVHESMESLYELACQLHKDTEDTKSGHPEVRQAAIQNINDAIFGSGYAVPEAGAGKKNAKEVADMCSHAHNALSLAVSDLALYQMMAKESCVEAARENRVSEETCNEWTAMASKADERYLELRETVVDPLQENRLETTHRLAPVIAVCPSDRKSLSFNTDIAIGSDGLLTAGTAQLPQNAAGALGGVPAGPSLGIGGALGITLAEVNNHANRGKHGGYLQLDMSMNVPAGVGVITDIASRSMAGVRDDEGFAGALVHATGDVVTEALSDIVKHGDLHALLRSPGANFQVLARMPPAVQGHQPKPGIQYALMGTTEKKGLAVNTPNLLASNPYTQNGVLELGASSTMSRTNTRTLHIGDDIGFLLLRLGDTGIGRHIKRDADNQVDFDGTFEAFSQDRFETDALFNPQFNPVLNALIEVVRFDSTNPLKKLLNDDGTESPFISPLAAYAKSASTRISNLGPWAKHFAAGSKANPFEDPASLGSLNDVARKAQQWKDQEPDLLGRLKALKQERAKCTSQENLAFFTQTPEGRELMQRFWDFAKGHNEFISSSYGGATMEPEVNKAALDAVPTVLGQAARQAGGPFKRFLSAIGFNKQSDKKAAAEAAASMKLNAGPSAIGAEGAEHDSEEALSGATERRIQRMAAPLIEAEVGQPFSEESLDPATSISYKKLDMQPPGLMRHLERLGKAPNELAAFARLAMLSVPAGASELRQLPLRHLLPPPAPRLR